MRARSVKTGRTVAFQFPRARIGMNGHDEQIALIPRGAKIADVAGMKQVKHAVSEHDPASRAAVFFEHIVQTAAGKNFIARIH